MTTPEPAADVLSEIREGLKESLMTRPSHVRWLIAEVERLRAEADELRAEVLREAIDAIEAFADAAEQDAIASAGQAYGRNNRTVAAYREAAEIVHRMAGGAQ